MACEGPILQCVMNQPMVAAIGVAVGFVLAKAMQMRKRNRMGLGGTF